MRKIICFIIFIAVFSIAYAQTAIDVHNAFTKDNGWVNAFRVNGQPASTDVGYTLVNTNISGDQHSGISDCDVYYQNELLYSGKKVSTRNFEIAGNYTSTNDHLLFIRDMTASIILVFVNSKQVNLPKDFYGDCRVLEKDGLVILGVTDGRLWDYCVFPIKDPLNLKRYTSARNPSYTYGFVADGTPVLLDGKKIIESLKPLASFDKKVKGTSGVVKESGQLVFFAKASKVDVYRKQLNISSREKVYLRTDLTNWFDVEMTKEEINSKSYYIVRLPFQGQLNGSHNFGGYCTYYSIFAWCVHIGDDAYFQHQYAVDHGENSLAGLHPNEYDGYNQYYSLK